MGWGEGGKIMGVSTIFYVRRRGRGGGVNIYKKCFGGSKKFPIIDIKKMI
jgi:hypothetical protein